MAVTGRRRAPDTGDVVWLEFDPQSGHEQAGHRPALVLSPVLYNSKTGLMVCCPLTTQIKGYPFEVEFELDGVHCAALADQVKSLDWRTRRARHKGKVDQRVLHEVQAKLKVLLGIR
ncbi:MAG TPA: endoribonuclease MazF [Burkholderiales bacterium]|nr:endoribonuclease MazF [Burkholderiales bacterium]